MLSTRFHRLPCLYAAGRGYKPLAEFQFGSKFAYGSLALQYILFLCKMLPQPVGQQASSRFGTGTVDVLEQRMRTEYIQVVSIQMCRVCKFLAAVEAGCVIVQRSQLLPVDLCLLFPDNLCGETGGCGILSGE